ncbi:MAG TPA: NAD(P)/FAD-dependent oxidoreductase [Actinocrinis sp.]|nr:NAD(P)/FAD-dependent oxidoreductase [Actinocrinis sp.]
MTQKTQTQTQTQTPETKTAIVAGGGIAGPVAAMALLKAGIRATVYEAYPSSADGVGGGLSIAPNGLNALGVIDARDAVLGIGEPMVGMVMQNGGGKVLAEFGGLPGLPPMQFVWRPDLYRVLRDEAVSRGIAFEHGKKVVGLTDGPDRVTARFADGTEASADILVGADGIRSTVRGLIDPQSPAPRYSGLVSLAGTVDDTGLPSTHDKMHMVFGRRAFFGYQVREDGSGGWFVNLPQKTPTTLAEMRAVPAREWLRSLGEDFRADRVPAADLIARTDPARLLVIGPMEDIPSVPVWSRGRVVLVGDAAHPTSPSSGQGASLAIESAVQLARCLREQPHPQAFAAYEALRRDRVERIIKSGARANRNKAAGPVGRVARDLLMPLLMRMVRPEKMAWQFDYRIDWEQPVPVNA